MRCCIQFFYLFDRSAFRRVVGQFLLPVVDLLVDDIVSNDRWHQLLIHNVVHDLLVSDLMFKVLQLTRLDYDSSIQIRQKPVSCAVERYIL